MELITTSAAPSDVNLRANQICMIEFAYDVVEIDVPIHRTTSCLGGLQLLQVKEFVFFLYHAVWVLNMLNRNPVCRLGYLQI